ncbi:MAG: hypothetical protein IKD45_00870 [Clostridia bacterium]|nr:hypothetical protein [Clostridia bacterium]
MLKKLMKHDLRAMARFSVPMFIASGIISVVCCAMLYFTFSFAEEADTFIGGMLAVGSFYAMGIMAIAIMYVIVVIMVAVRYYKSLFTDEGYLNMVLPVKTTEMFNSKLLTSLIWTTLSGAVAIVCCLVSVFVPTALYDNEMMSTFLEDLSNMLTLFGATEQAPIVTVLGIISFIVSSVEGVLVIITAITLGSVIIKKYKIFGSIIFYFVINFVEENIIGVFELIMGSILGQSSENGYIFAMIFGIVVSVAVSVGMYIVNYYILNRRFNIE